jgi:hypothetical protein
MGNEMASGGSSISSNDERKSVSAAEPAPASRARRAGAWFLHELYEILPPVIFFPGRVQPDRTDDEFDPRRLLRRRRQLHDRHYCCACRGQSGAGRRCDAFSRYDRAPLLEPILFKTVVYWVFAFIARLLEALVEFLMQGHSLGEFLPHLVSTFSWHRFAAIQIWIFVLFLICVTASELNELFGQGELRRIFLTHRPSELQLNRRQRIRELVHLSRLADTRSDQEFRDPASAAHGQLVEIVRRLAG